MSGEEAQMFKLTRGKGEEEEEEEKEATLEGEEEDGRSEDGKQQGGEVQLLAHMQALEPVLEGEERLRWPWP